MEVQCCEYIWEIPFIDYNMTYQSEMFPKGDATLKWNIVTKKVGCFDNYSTLRTISAPLGEIEVKYSVKYYKYKEQHPKSKKKECHYESDTYIYGYSFEHYSNTTLPEISKIEFGFHNERWNIDTMRIRIAATIKRQLKCQEQCSISSTMHLEKGPENSYVEELIRVIQADSEFYDITISVGKIEFQAHKAILAAVSPVFRAALTNMLEKKSSCIKIEDFNIEIVRFMMEFIYKGRVKLNHHHEAMDLLRLSDIYQMPCLQKFCVSYLTTKMNQNNILDIIAVAEIANADDLTEVATNFFLNNPKPFKADNFKDIIKFKPDKLAAFLEKLTAAYSNNKQEYF